MILRNTGLILIALGLSSCGWVDSTGNQAASEDLPAFIDSSLAVLSDGETVDINENTTKSVVFNAPDNLVGNWNWALLNGQADISQCASVENFDQTEATNVLQVACADNETCNVTIDETTSDDVTRFTLTTPQLRAPVALEYRLIAQAPEGPNLERTQLVCATPINDAPDAAEDRYSVIRGSELIVDGNSSDSLLANDEDDNDYRNDILQVITTPVKAPEYAANFEIFANGGFIYEPLPNAPISIGALISDRFTYTVTDGTSTSSATVKIKIINVNTAPVQTSNLPESKAYIVSANTGVTIANLGAFFTDAENDTLIFSAVNGTLPESGNIDFTEDGRLVGSLEDEDSGRYFVELEVSDSIESVTAGFYLDITRTNGVNKAPFANDISNATVSDDFSYDITPFFEDADGDHMTFTATGMPLGVEISPNGIISGTVTDDNSGRSVIRVFANDGNGGVSSDGFRLWLR